ncbi:putative hydrolase YxeP [Lacunisphaera limnophila]|uniref:Putative hydrolase YxeP n=1 Tax=Lacunisphaera limnophila TaxID=1838286 RepID=A0A1D8AU17_9BACT|nr:amidohydrolase [Lacunisphaera limnophila]AOS44389.1 putative hydrolase YxeP [Lacunisphaera limnophila]
MTNRCLLAALLLLPSALSVAAEDVKAVVARKISADYPSLEAIYRDLHAHPELSFMETRTAALLAQELRTAGYEVTEQVGNTGVVAVLRNGPGPTVMIRGDMDALPMTEKTGLPYAATGTTKTLTGTDSPAMHACAHDMHVTGLIGTARMLMALKDRWSGTLVLIGQPAEEIGAGAVAMLRDGLYTRFPHPDYVLALHVGDAEAGTVRYVSGPTYANVDSLDITVRGVGGHGARPHSTRDPVVLASQIVLALQTIVSRELVPGTPAVVTVGAINGGTKHNIIPDEVKLQLTLRSYDDAVADQLVGSIRRICEHLARAAGVPEDRLPVVAAFGSRTPVTVNDPVLTQRLTAVFREWLPPERVLAGEAATYGEDFSHYSRTPRKVPACIFWIGGSDPAVITAARASGQLLPSNHSPHFAPLPEPTIKTGVTTLTAAALDLLAKK